MLDASSRVASRGAVGETILDAVSRTVSAGDGITGSSWTGGTEGSSGSSARASRCPAYGDLSWHKQTTKQSTEHLLLLIQLGLIELVPLWMIQ